VDTTSERTRLRDLLAVDYGWTPRQREVLDLITRGRSNQEIAHTLGISLDGAKWHMREILSKLNVDTREEAAEYWRRHNGFAPRFARLFRSVTGASVGKWLAGALVGGALVGMVAAALALALNGDDDSAAGDPEPTSAVETSTPTETISPTSSPTAAATTPRAITGLFDAPGDTSPDVVRSLPPATSPFPAWDGRSTVIYDTLTNEVIDLGPGTNVSWSPNGTRAAWVSGDGPNVLYEGGVAKVIRLRDRAQEELGPARLAQFTDDQHVLLAKPESNDAVLVDLVTGERSESSLPRFPAETTEPFHLTVAEFTGPPLERGGNASAVWELRETATDRPVLRFTAFQARLAERGTLLVATVPVDRLSNLFLVDINTGQADYIATARISSPNWPLSASKRWVVWTDGYCDEEPGQVRLYDRKSGEVIALDDGLDPGEAYNNRWMELTRNDLLQVGTFNGGTLLDPKTLEYKAVIPGTHVSWSPDFRYGAQGQFGGHGGLC
jgi:DNA-binding CsgD family transcriptional regulator